MGCLILALLQGGLQADDKPLVLRGTNGTEIEVYGILEATPGGLLLKVKPEDDLTLVPWSRIDPQHLREHQPEIYYSYLDVRELGRPILLKLGGFTGVIGFEEAITRLYQGMERTRYYPLPENVDYLFDDDPNIMRAKSRDFNRYAREIRTLRRELQTFLRIIYPKEYIIIDDSGQIHRKLRQGIPESDKGETSLRVIVEYLADTRQTISRAGITYLRQVTHFREDFHELSGSLRPHIPNQAFRWNDANHMKLPVLMDESRTAIDHFLDARSYHRGQQFKLGEYFNFVYGHADRYGLAPTESTTLTTPPADFPRLDFSGGF